MKTSLLYSIGGAFLVLIFFKTEEIEGKVFNRCSLAREMYRLGVPKSELPHWICIVQHESSFNSKAVGKVNRNGTRDWGLFQLNDRYWCKPPTGKSSNTCKVTCSSLLSDDIAASVKCARLVKKNQGFTAWVAWKNKCQGRRPSVLDCF